MFSSRFTLSLRGVLVMLFITTASFGFAQNNVHVSDASGTDAITCGAPGSPCATIQYALDSIAQDGDTIQIDTGLYKLPSSVNQYVPVVRIPQQKKLSFVGTVSGLGTRIDGDTTRRGIMYFYAGGSCPSDSSNDGIADTVELYFKDIIVQNCHIVETCGSTTYAYGGGMRIDADTASELHVTVESCIFRNNRSYDPSGPNSGGRSASGGAIWIYGKRNANASAEATYAEAFIIDCDFSGNYADQISNGGHGGAVLLRDLDTAAVVNSSFCDNYVYSTNADNGDMQHDRNGGGAMCFYDRTSTNPGHKYHIDGCTFINNTATVSSNLNFPSEGGGVFLTKGDVLSATTSAVLHISNTNFYNNNVEAGIEHFENNSGTIDTSNIGNNGLYNQFEIDLGNDTTLCSGDTMQLNAFVVGAVYLWNNGFTGPILNIIQGDTYMVTVTVGTCEVSDTIVIDQAQNPIVDLGPDTTICPYDSLVLDATWAGANYTWSNNSNDSILTVFSAGTYWVEVDVSGCIGSDTIEVDTVPLSQVNLGPDTILCDGAPLTLNAFQTGATYVWQDASTSSSLAVNSNDTLYSVTVSLDGCELNDTVIVDFGTSPIVDLGPNDTICPYASITLNAMVQNATYVWSTGATSSSINVASQGTYWVEVDSLGCASSDTIDIDTVTLAPVNLGPNTQLCDAQTMTLNASQSGASYLWQDGSTNPGFTVTQAGTYTVTVSKLFCQYIDDVAVTYQAFPVVDLGADQTICPYDNVLLDATNAGAQYQWSTGHTSATLNVSDENTYIVVVNLNGCIKSDTVTIDTVQIPPSYLGPNQLLCPDDVYTLDATTQGASNYLWHDASTGSTLNGGTAGLKWVQVSVGPCQVSDSIHITYVVEPATILGNDISVCEDKAATINVIAQGMDNFLWSTGSTQSSIVVNSGGDYMIQASKQGCPFFDTLTVEKRPLPDVDFGVDKEACDGDTLYLDATHPNAIYDWNSAFDGPIKRVTKSGTYAVTVYMDGCYSDGSVYIKYKPNPVPELLDDISKCEGKSHSFNAYRKAFDAYLWSNGSTDSVITVSDSGIYSVQVWMDGCSGSDTVLFSTVPIPELDLGLDSMFCEGDEIILDAAAEGDVTYLWHDQSHESTYKVWRGGGYSVKVNRDGCINKDSINFNMYYYPKLNIGNDTTICIGDSFKIQTNDPNSTFIWNGFEEKTEYVVNDSSYIHVEATSVCGTTSDSIIVTTRDCECFMYIPKAFTPGNDDEYNATFSPQFDCDLYNYQMRIYDRWGHLIFESKNPDKGWDGKLNGEKMMMGAYGYELIYDAQLEVNGSRVHTQKVGVITLLR